MIKACQILSQRVSDDSSGGRLTTLGGDPLLLLRVWYRMWHTWHRVLLMRVPYVGFSGARSGVVCPKVRLLLRHSFDACNARNWGHTHLILFELSVISGWLLLHDITCKCLRSNKICLTISHSLRHYRCSIYFVHANTPAVHLLCTCLRTCISSQYI